MPKKGKKKKSPSRGPSKPNPKAQKAKAMPAKRVETHTMASNTRGEGYTRLKDRKLKEAQLEGIREAVENEDYEKLGKNLFELIPRNKRKLIIQRYNHLQQFNEDLITHRVEFIQILLHDIGLAATNLLQTCLYVIQKGACSNITSECVHLAYKIYKSNL